MSWAQLFMPPNSQMLELVRFTYLICLGTLCPVIFILVMKCDAQVPEGSTGADHLVLN